MLLFKKPISKGAQIGVFDNFNSLDDLGRGGLVKSDDSGNYYYHLTDFDFDRQTMSAGRWGMPPLLNITQDCRKKLLAKNTYAKEILIYKIFRMRPSDPVKEPGNLKLGITHVYELFFQLFYYRAHGIDKYSKVDVEGVCGEKIAIFFFHTIANETLTTNYKNVYAQSPIKAPVQQFMKWYDTFNPNSDFYNSICSGYTYNTMVDKFLKQEDKLKYYDTPLDVRRKYFGGNLYLCPDYCTYSGIFAILTFFLPTCHCKDPKMNILSDPNYTPPAQYMQPFDYDEEKFNKNKDSFFSIGVLGCFMFTFILGMQNNYGCYIILGIGTVIIFSFIELLIFGKKRIIEVLELLYNNNINPKSDIKINNVSANRIIVNDKKIFDNIPDKRKNSNLVLISSSSKSPVESNNYITNTNISRNTKNKFYGRKISTEKSILKHTKTYEKSENEDEYYFQENFDEKTMNVDKVDKFEKEIKIYPNSPESSIYRNQKGKEKEKENQKKMEANYDREESEDSEKVEEGEVKNNIQNIGNNHEEIEEEEEVEQEEEERGEGGENANPPKIKIKVKKKKVNNIYPNKRSFIEMPSVQPLSQEKIKNSPENQIIENNRLVRKKSIIRKTNRNSLQQFQGNSEYQQQSPELELVTRNKRSYSKKQSKVRFKDIHLGLDSILNTHNNFPEIPKSKLHFRIDNIFTDQELNYMNFTQFLKYDKRTYFQMYLSFLNEHSPLFFLLHYYNSDPNGNLTFQIRYPSAKLIFFCIELYVCFFFNCTVFGTKSAGYQFYGTYTFWKHLAFGVVLSPFCLIVDRLLHYLIFFRVTRKIIAIKLLFYTKILYIKKEKTYDDFEYFIKKEHVSKYHRVITKIENIDPDDLHRLIKHERKDLKEKVEIFFNIYKKKIIGTFILSCLGTIFMWYYVTALCVAFKNSQSNFLLNVLLTFVCCNLLSGGYCFLIAYVRQKALKERRKLYFVVSLILKFL